MTQKKEKHWLDRSRLLVKEDGIMTLKNSSVLVVGIGGVGGFAAEFLARSGVGKICIVDADNVDLTNINRQIAALHSTIGLSKAQVIGNRIRDINPECELRVVEKFLEPEMAYDIIDHEFDYVIDCIDSISPKLALIRACAEKSVPLISSMGAGGKADPSMLRVADISKSRNCPLARHLRKRIKQDTGHHAKGFDVVYSEELADESSIEITDGSDYKKSFYGTISYMPALFGIYAASHVLRKLLKII